MDLIQQSNKDIATTLEEIENQLQASSSRENFIESIENAKKYIHRLSHMQIELERMAEILEKRLDKNSDLLSRILELKSFIVIDNNVNTINSLLDTLKNSKIPNNFEQLFIEIQQDFRKLIPFEFKPKIIPTIIEDNSGEKVCVSIDNPDKIKSDNETLDNCTDINKFAIILQELIESIKKNEATQDTIIYILTDDYGHGLSELLTNYDNNIIKITAWDKFNNNYREYIFGTDNQIFKITSDSGINLTIVQLPSIINLIYTSSRFLLIDSDLAQELLKSPEGRNLHLFFNTASRSAFTDKIKWPANFIHYINAQGYFAKIFQQKGNVFSLVPRYTLDNQNLKLLDEAHTYAMSRWFNEPGISQAIVSGIGSLWQWMSGVEFKSTEVAEIRLIKETINLGFRNDYSLPKDLFPGFEDVVIIAPILRRSNCSTADKILNTTNKLISQLNGNL